MGYSKQRKSFEGHFKVWRKGNACILKLSIRFFLTDLDTAHTPVNHQELLKVLKRVKLTKLVEIHESHNI